MAVGGDILLATTVLCNAVRNWSFQMVRDGHYLACSVGAGLVHTLDSAADFGRHLEDSGCKVKVVRIVGRWRELEEPSQVACRGGRGLRDLTGIRIGGAHRTAAEVLPARLRKQRTSSNHFIT